MSATGAAIGVVVGGILGSLIGSALGTLSPSNGTDDVPGLAGAGVGLLLGAIAGAYVGAERPNPLPLAARAPQLAGYVVPRRRPSGTRGQARSRRR